MKANKIILGLLLSFLCLNLFAENADSIKIVRLEQSLQKEVKARENIQAVISSQTKLISNQSQIIDSLKSAMEQNTKNIQSMANQFNVKIDQTNASLGSKADFSDVKNKTVWGSILLALLAALGGLIYYLLHRRINKRNEDVDVLKQKAEKLNEEILNQFSLEMSELQKISSTLDAMSKNSASASGTSVDSQDHSLIKTLADRITFMEMTLFKMDPKIKGYKQLSKSIAQMKDNLLANGYELVDMLGKPYNDGMKAVANFNDDEEIEEGQRIITAIIKPQINYKGQMIQAAQITVSQNIQ